MNLSGLITRLINTMAILLVALTQNAVLSKPTNFHNDPSVSAVDASSEKLSMDYYKTTTPKNTKLHSRDISLGALLSKSVLQEQQQPEIIKRYRRVSLMGLDNVDVATSLLQDIRNRQRQRLRNAQRSNDELTVTIPTVQINRNRYRNRLRHPGRMRPAMIAQILRLIEKE